MKTRFSEINDDDFIELIKNSINISEVLYKLGYAVSGNSWGYTQIKTRMKKLNLSMYDFKGKSTMKQYQREVTPEEIFCEQSGHSRKVLRAYIIRHNILPYKCSICGISKWQGKQLSLHLDHINGVNDDDRLENLRFLCPNCHSQTDTYGARNMRCKVSHRDINNELRHKICSEYQELKNMYTVAKKLNVVFEVVNQCVTEAGLKKTNQKYVLQYDKNKNLINRFGSITECSQWLMDNNMVRTRIMKTCKNTLKRNAGKLWNGYYFDIVDSQIYKLNN